MMILNNKMQDNMQDNVQDSNAPHELSREELIYITHWVSGFMSSIDSHGEPAVTSGAPGGEGWSDRFERLSRYLDGALCEALSYEVDPLCVDVLSLASVERRVLAVGAGDHNQLITFLIYGCRYADESPVVKRLLACLGYDFTISDYVAVINSATRRLRFVDYVDGGRNLEIVACADALLKLGICVKRLDQLSSSLASLMICTWATTLRESEPNRDGANSGDTDTDIEHDSFLGINTLASRLGSDISKYESSVNDLIESILLCESIDAFRKQYESRYVNPSANPFSLEDINLFHDGLLRALTYAQTIHELFVDRTVC
jgi:hypothetical protein